MEAVRKTKINRNWKVKVMEGDREVAGSSTSLNKWPIPADARSYRRLTNTHQPACLWPRELAVIRVFSETLWVKPMLVLCIRFLCWWSLSRQTIPLKIVPFAPCQLPSSWIWPKALKRKWKAEERKAIEHFWPTLSVWESTSPPWSPLPLSVQQWVTPFMNHQLLPVCLSNGDGHSYLVLPDYLLASLTTSVP